MPEERLELISAVSEENHDALDDLADRLDEVDDQIAQAGGGENKIEIDVEIDGLTTTLGKLEAIDERLDSIDDSNVSIDGPEIEHTGSRAMATSGGFPGFPDNYEPDNDEGVTGRGDIFTSRNHPSINKPSFDDVMNVDKKLITSANPETPFDGPFGAGTGVAGNRRIMELMDVLDGEGGKLQRQIDDLDAVDKLLGGDNDVDVSVDEMRAMEGVEVPALDDDMAGFDDLAVSGEDKSFKKRLDGLKEQVRELQFTMGTFHQIIASIIPFLGVFVGAMPAAITGLVTLGGAALIAAGALAGIGGLGLMGIGMDGSGGISIDAINEALSGLKDSFVDAFAPLSQKFAPLIQTTITELERMMGPLAGAASLLTEFQDTFMGAMRTATDILPGLVQTSLSFAQATLPLLEGIASFILNKDILGFLSNQLANALPELAILGNVLVEMLPAIVRISQGFLLFASALAVPIGLISYLINTIPYLGQVLGLLGASFLGLIGISTLYTIQTVAATKATLNLARSIVGTAISGLKSFALALKPMILQLHAYTISTLGATYGTIALVGALTLGIGAVAIFASQFAILGGNIKEATKNLRQFANTKNAMDGGTSFGTGVGTGGGSRATAYRDNSTTIIQAGDRDSAARQQYSSSYEKQQHVDNIFSG